MKKSYAKGLFILSGLFALLMPLQLLQSKWETGSEILPLWLLLLVRLVLLCLMLHIAIKIWRRRLYINPMLGRWLLPIGVVYALGILLYLSFHIFILRHEVLLAAGFNMLAHLLLADYLMLLATFHCSVSPSKFLMQRLRHETV